MSKEFHALWGFFFCHPLQLLYVHYWRQCGSITLQEGLLSLCRSRGVTFSSVSFDREALIAASFPNVTHQQQGETASALKLNHNVWTSVNTWQSYPITRDFAILFLINILTRKKKLRTWQQLQISTHLVLQLLSFQKLEQAQHYKCNPWNKRPGSCTQAYTMTFNRLFNYRSNFRASCEGAFHSRLRFDNKALWSSGEPPFSNCCCHQITRMPLWQ